jgi:hypothetical protein
MSNDLEAFLQSYSDLVVVYFWQEESESNAYIERLTGAVDRFKNVPIIQLTFSEHVAWAQAHGVYGTPAIIVYYQHQPLFRLIGRVTPSELLQRLKDFGV